MRIAFTRSRSGGLLNRPSPRKRLLPKKKTSSGFEFVSGLATGASVMPAKWSRRVFSFRFYEGEISVPVTLTSCAFRKSYPDVPLKKAPAQERDRTPQPGAPRHRLIGKLALHRRKQPTIENG